MTEVHLPVIELDQYSQNRGNLSQACAQVAQSFQKYSLVIVKFSAIKEEINRNYLDLFIRYFSQTLATKNKDQRPELHYQTGFTGVNTECARRRTDAIAELEPSEHPLINPEGMCDNKERFFLPYGSRPSVHETAFPALNAPVICPAGFDNFENITTQWGNQIYGVTTLVAEMLALGLNLPVNAFTDRMLSAPHLIAPTGSDLNKHGKLKTILAEFHTDLGIFTAHSKSNFPALEAWADGKKFKVKVPDGCFLIQAGMDLEYLTGGHIIAGLHQVTVLPETIAAIEKAKQQGRPLYRVSATMFTHTKSDSVLQPIGKFNTKETRIEYPPILQGQFVLNELAKIKLSRQGEDMPQAS